MKHLTTLFLILTAAGCGSTEQAKTKANQIVPNTAAMKTKEKNLPSETITNDGVTGIVVCDDYLSRMKVCLKKPDIPEAAKAVYQQSLEQNRTAWKQAEKFSEGKKQLETSCKMATESAKSFFESCK